MTPEQQQRIGQIKRKWLTAADGPIKSEIDFLLSLVSQEAGSHSLESPKMLTEKQITEISEAVDAGAGVSPETGMRLCSDWRALHRQISELKTVVDVATNDDPATALSKLHKIQHTAATSMRSACVDAIKSLRATPRGLAYNNAINDAIHKVESVSIQEQ